MSELFFKEKYVRFLRERPFSFSQRSTIGCGGVADIAFYPQTQAEWLQLVRGLKEDGVPFYTVGNLSNVLPTDGRIESAVVCTKKMQTVEGCFFASGISSAKLLAYCKSAQKSGAEFLTGIPCTLGGALFMNAGVGGRYIAEIVQSVRVYREGKVVTLSNAECAYAYKKSAFMDGDWIILGATLSLVDSDGETVEREIARYHARRAHLPKGRSMGCVFKNPEGYVAGKLIEDMGLKGLRVGGAVVSPTHANFIINERNATALDIRTLIARIKGEVLARFGITLEEEIRYLT